MGVISLSETVRRSPVADSSEKGDHEYMEGVAKALPRDWITQERCEELVAGVAGFPDHRLPADADTLIARMVESGWLERRGGERWPEFRRPAKDPELEIVSPQRAAEIEHEQQVAADSEKAAQKAEANAREYEERLRVKREEEDRDFLELYDRLVGGRLTAMEARIVALEGRWAT
jgi:hypothetical protein